LLSEGYKVAATSRTVESLEREAGTSANFLALEADVTDENSVRNAIARTLETFGTIDVLVNNAGYGQLGTLEELSDEEARANFDTNVFGLLHVMRNVVPHMRSKKSGHIINISSIAGFLGAFPGWGVYNATKFAVAGLTEAFSAEAASSGIQATIVYPGYFKTNFLLQGSLRLAENPIEAYKEARELEVVHNTQVIGNQPGDPEKLAEVLMNVASQANPPLHLVLGSDALGLAEKKADSLRQVLDANRAMSVSTDYAAATPGTK